MEKSFVKIEILLFIFLHILLFQNSTCFGEYETTIGGKRYMMTDDGMWRIFDKTGFQVAQYKFPQFSYQGFPTERAQFLHRRLSALYLENAKPIAHMPNTNTTVFVTTDPFSLSPSDNTWFSVIDMTKNRQLAAFDRFTLNKTFKKHPNKAGIEFKRDLGKMGINKPEAYFLQNMDRLPANLLPIKVTGLTNPALEVPKLYLLEPAKNGGRIHVYDILNQRFISKKPEQPDIPALINQTDKWLQIGYDNFALYPEAFRVHAIDPTTGRMIVESVTKPKRSKRFFVVDFHTNKQLLPSYISNPRAQQPGEPELNQEDIEFFANDDPISKFALHDRRPLDNENFLADMCKVKAAKARGFNPQTGIIDPETGRFTIPASGGQVYVIGAETRISGPHSPNYIGVISVSDGRHGISPKLNAPGRRVYGVISGNEWVGPFDPHDPRVSLALRHQASFNDLPFKNGLSAIKKRTLQVAEQYAPPLFDTKKVDPDEFERFDKILPIQSGTATGLEQKLEPDPETEANIKRYVFETNLKKFVEEGTKTRLDTVDKFIAGGVGVAVSLGFAASIVVPMLTAANAAVMLAPMPSGVNAPCNKLYITTNNLTADGFVFDRKKSYCLPRHGHIAKNKKTNQLLEYNILPGKGPNKPKTAISPIHLGQINVVLQSANHLGPDCFLYFHKAADDLQKTQAGLMHLSYTPPQQELELHVQQNYCIYKGGQITANIESTPDGIKISKKTTPGVFNQNKLFYKRMTRIAILKPSANEKAAAPGELMLNIRPSNPETINTPAISLAMPAKQY